MPPWCGVSLYIQYVLCSPQFAINHRGGAQSIIVPLLVVINLEIWSNEGMNRAVPG
jgi:hypothetical protein